MIMAAASNSSAMGDGADPAEAERKKKFEKIKKEIRSILITATQTGRSPEELDADFRDLNGRPIPYRELGFNSLFDLLDAIPDVIDAYQLDYGITLFAKSTKATQHLEHLIAKAKPTKLARFGGIIQQPATSRRGTPERRKLIERRLIEVALQFPGYVSYHELFNAYQARFYESFDPKGDFCVQPKQVFNLKLERWFDVKDGSAGSGGFSIRLKNREEAAAFLNSSAPKRGPSSSSTNVLGAGGFAKPRTSAAPPPLSQPAATSQNVSAYEQEERENIPPAASPRPPPFSIRPDELFPQPISVQHAVARPQFPPPPPFPVRFPPVSLPFGAQFMTFQVQPQPMPPAHAMPPFPMMVTPFNAGVANRMIGPPAHQLFFGLQRFAGHPPIFAAMGIPPAPVPTMVTPPNFGPVLFPPQMVLPTQQQQFPVMEQQQYPVQPESADSGVAVTPTESALDVNAAPFEPKMKKESSSDKLAEAAAYTPERPSASSVANAEHPSVSSSDATLRPAVGSPQSTEAQSGSPVQSKWTKSADVSKGAVTENVDNEAAASLRRYLQRRLELDRPGVENWVATASKVGNDTMDIAATASAASTRDETLYVANLKAECRKILHRFPNGISYLGFGKAFKDVTGKDLESNLEPLNLLSVGELIEDWPDVFHTQKMETGEVLLFDKDTYSEREHNRSTTDSHVEQKDSIGKWAESTGEDALVAELWRIIMKAPNRTLRVNQISSAYEEATGKAFPISGRGIDDFALTLFEYVDRFEYAYDDKAGLRFTAIPDFDDLALDNSADDAYNAAIAVEYVQYGFQYMTQQLPISSERLRTLDESDPSRYFQVRIAQVFDPGHFYVQLQSTVGELEELMGELNEYFMEPRNLNRARIGSTALVVGLPCASLCDEDGSWYRSVITDVLDGPHLAVLLVDFGTEVETTLDKIRYLPREYFSTPAQAILTRLAAVAPVGEAWTIEAGDRMTELCGDSFMWAELYKIDDEEGVAEVFLTLTDDNGEETHINDALINSGFARFSVVETADIESGVNSLHLDLEHEIDSPEGSSSEVHNGVMAGEEELEPLEQVLSIDLENQIIEQLERAIEEGDAGLEDIIQVTRAFLIRRRLEASVLMTRSSDPTLVPLAVDKVTWLEKQINWLNELSKD